MKVLVQISEAKKREIRASSGIGEKDVEDEFYFFWCACKENAIVLNETDPKINKISSFQMSPFNGIAKGQFISKANGEVDSVCGLLCFPISSAKEVINAQ